MRLYITWPAIFQQAAKNPTNPLHHESKVSRQLRTTHIARSVLMKPWYHSRVGHQWNNTCHLNPSREDLRSGCWPTPWMVIFGISTYHQPDVQRSVVYNLTQPLFGLYHQVYCDNFFSSISLFQTLYSNKTYACGTIRSNRKYFPKDLLSEANSMGRGKYVYRQCDNLVATVWKDKKPVTMLSTLSHPTNTVTFQRRKKDGTRIEVTCPSAVKLYNLNMSGVDKGDQMRGYYRARCKSKKNYNYNYNYN